MNQHLWDFCKFCLLFSQAILIVAGLLFFYSDSNPAWLGELVGAPMLVVAAGSLFGMWWVKSASRPTIGPGISPELKNQVRVPIPAPPYVRSNSRVSSVA